MAPSIMPLATYRFRMAKLICACPSSLLMVLTSLNSQSMMVNVLAPCEQCSLSTFLPQISGHRFSQINLTSCCVLTALLSLQINFSTIFQERISAQPLPSCCPSYRQESFFQRIVLDSSRYRYSRQDCARQIRVDFSTRRGAEEVGRAVEVKRGEVASIGYGYRFIWLRVNTEELIIMVAISILQFQERFTKQSQRARRYPCNFQKDSPLKIQFPSFLGQKINYLKTRMKTALTQRRQRFTQEIRRTSINSQMKERRCMLLTVSDQPLIQSALSIFTIKESLETAITTFNSDLIAQCLIHLAGILSSFPSNLIEVFASRIPQMIIKIVSLPYVSSLNTQSVITIKNKSLFIISKLSKHEQMNEHLVLSLSLIDFVISELEMSNPLKLRNIVNFFGNVVTLPQIHLEIKRKNIDHTILEAMQTHMKWVEQLAPVYLMYFKNLLLCKERDNLQTSKKEIDKILDITLPIFEGCSEYENDPQKELVLLDALKILKILETKKIGLELHIDPINRIITSKTFSQQTIQTALQILLLQVQINDPEFIITSMYFLQTLIEMSEFQPYRVFCLKIFGQSAKHPFLHPLLKQTCEYIGVSLMSDPDPVSNNLLWQYVYNYFEANAFEPRRPHQERLLEMIVDSSSPWKNEKEVYLWYRLTENKRRRTTVPKWIMEIDEECMEAEREELIDFIRKNTQEQEMY